MTVALRVVQVAVHLVIALGRMAVVALVTRRRAAPAAEVARLLERLGGAFLKAGQLLATRVDVVGETLAAELGRLHDHVAPMSAKDALLTARRSFARPPDEMLAALARPPIASGSIACVYRMTWQGRDLAVKVRRPGVARVFAADTAVVGGLARFAARIPRLARLPLTDIVGQLGEALRGQLDFDRETRHLHRLRADLADVAGVIVPEAVDELTAGGVITMTFVEGLTKEPGDRAAVERGVTTLVRAVYHMLFVRGFIHVDLHQGNAYIRAGGEVVVLDAGFMFPLSEMARTSFTRFFGGMIKGDGESCARILLASARGVADGADVAGFQREVADLVNRSSGAVAQDFELGPFAVRLFDLQRSHAVFAEPEFVFPLLCLLALEGTVRRLHPLMDFQMEAAPYVMQGLLTGALTASEAPENMTI
ncbi:ABC1 kinase family protein [Herbidospora yilanensis]|uniref:ABC1 kinase family protein n=1 Tax=Herbidospora yilanensis TaxID=354426 RepID=UPI000783DE11|nr:AarF/UbiB family protein [Herbidospora yilanensis]